MDVGKKTGIGALIFALIAVIGSSSAVDMNPEKYFLQHTNDIQQDVSGEGYAMVYQYVNTNNLSVKNYMHGSGVMDMATLISSNQKKENKVEYLAKDDYGKPYLGGAYKTYKNRDSTISFTEQNEMTYSPETFIFGTGYYAAHPIRYESLLKERTEGKNYQEGIALLHQIEYARAFKKDIFVNVNCTGTTHKVDGTGSAELRIEEDVTQGTIQIGEILSRPDWDYTTSKGWSPDKNAKAFSPVSAGGIKDPLVVIDENYIGNYKIKKNIRAVVTKPKVSEAYDWLPCCTGGFFDLDVWERYTTDRDGVFDCTCTAQALKNFKPSWDGTKAQFPEPSKKI